MGRLRLARPFVTITLSLALCALRLNSTSPAGFRVCQCSNNGLTSSSCQIFAGIFETIDSVLMTASNCLLIFGRSHLQTLTPTWSPCLNCRVLTGMGYWEDSETGRL